MERMKAMLEGNPVDRPLVSAWGHLMNLEDRHAGDFAKATIDLQNSCQFDFIKVMPNSYYMAEDFGNVLRPSENSLDPGFFCCERLAVQTSEDWKKLKVLDPAKGALEREVSAVRQICDYYKGEVPVIPTIFSPLTWLTYLFLEMEVQFIMNRKRPGGVVPFIIDYTEHHEAEVKYALEVIAESNDRLMEAFLDAGAHGFFFSQPYANTAWEKDRFENFAGKYDRQNLSGIAGKALFVMLHVCGTRLLNFDLVLDYPVNAFNWDDQSPDNPSIADIRAKTNKVLVGGVNKDKDLYGSDREKIKATIKQKVYAALKAGGEKTIISGGCSWEEDAKRRFVVMNEAIDEIACELTQRKN
jgi:uroporphyrinogen decarboxylase